MPWYVPSEETHSLVRTSSIGYITACKQEVHVGGKSVDNDHMSVRRRQTQPLSQLVVVSKTGLHHHLYSIQGVRQTLELIAPTMEWCSYLL